MLKKGNGPIERMKRNLTIKYHAMNRIPKNFLYVCNSEFLYYKIKMIIFQAQ